MESTLIDLWMAIGEIISVDDFPRRAGGSVKLDSC